MAVDTIPTRMMVISDTHEHPFDSANMPEVDVLIHTGDLTNFGELSSLRDSMEMLANFNAELKLVIAGNHDISLDSICRVDNMAEEEYSQFHKTALEILAGPSAKEAGIFYLDEGTHTFTLKSGAKFTVYASPYTPGFGGWAFPYQPLEDRFNSAEDAAPNRRSIAKNPILSGVDIVMTHGPPYSVLDQVDGQHLGCPNLLRAVSRTKPLMHCFGHIHEGHGANLVTWKPDGTVKGPSAAANPLESEQVNDYPEANDWAIEAGRQTLMVNAAMMYNTSRGMRPNYNKAFIVDIPLRKHQATTVRQLDTQ